MAKTRYIDIYWDVIANVHRNSSGDEVKKNYYPYMFFKEEVIVNLWLVIDSSLTAFTDLDGTEQYGASINHTFTRQAIMVQTLDAGINVAGDFIGNSSGDADPNNGEFSIRLNGNTANFETAVGTSDPEKKNTKLELRAMNASGQIVFVTQMPFRAYNLIDDESSTPSTLSSLGIFQVGDGAARVLQLKDEDGVIYAEWPRP